jgi:hypothetical protein
LNQFPILDIFERLTSIQNKLAYQDNKSEYGLYTLSYTRGSRLDPIPTVNIFQILTSILAYEHNK